MIEGLLQYFCMELSIVLWILASKKGRPHNKDLVRWERGLVGTLMYRLISILEAKLYGLTLPLHT